MQYAIEDAKSWARENLRGFYVCPTTPFQDNLELDEEGLRGNIDRFVGLGSVSGLYINSVFAEHHALTIAERKRAAELVVDQVAGRVPVVVETTAESIHDAIDLGRHAREIGADLVLLGAPVVGLRTRDGVLEYLRTVIASCDIGVCIFSTTWADVGFHIDAHMLAELAQLDAVCCVKDATGSMGAFLSVLRAVGDELMVSRPNLAYWLAARGTLTDDRLVPPLYMGTISPMYADEHAQAFEAAVQRGDWGEAVEQVAAISQKTSAIARNHAMGHHDVARFKAVSKLLGYASGPVRPPLSYPDESGWNDLLRDLELSRASLPAESVA